MARGLSDQQRRILVAAFRHYQQSAERNRDAESNRRYLENYREPDQWRGPNVPIPHLTRGDGLRTLHGWVSGVEDRVWWEEGRRIQGERIRVWAKYYHPSGDPAVATISRSEYEVAQASVSRTLTRLVARGLLGPHGYYVGYDLTEAGIHASAQLAAQLATGLAEGEREGAF